MKRITRTSRTVRHASVAALALTLSLGLAACGDDADEAGDAGSDPTSAMTQDSTEESSEPAAEPMTADTFGAGCSAIPTDGKGSLDGMMGDPVATAASNNPLLKTLVTAVGEADLVDTLNAAPALTVFAPTDDAFAKIPAKKLKGLLADKEALTQVLTHHVVEGQLSPEQVVGTHDTLAGDTVTVSGEVPELVADNATIICGNVPTANATVYVIDSVLMPKM